tara:strand:- start:123 stop:581 length:459 start_codon:yes stop_codon:yes gene_type:complete
MKEVPADKKKSLGKLPTEVRNKMGYMRKGGKVSKDKMTNSQEAYAEGLRTGKGLPILRNIDKGISKAVSTPKEKRMIEKGYEDMRKAKKAEKARKKVAKPAAPTKPQKSTNINKDSKRKAPRKRTLKQNRVGILKMNEGGMVIVDRNYLKGR